MEKENSFQYTYSAAEQEELRRIREKYMPRDEREQKLERLYRLDAGVTMKGTIAAIILGIIGCLVLGIGMCCCMVWEGLLTSGIIIGAVGIIGIALAYPAYKHVTRKERERVAPEILKLTEELMK